MIDALESWLRTAATRVHVEAASLTALDQAIGDGDHGTNLDRGFGAIVAMLDAQGPVDPSQPPAAAAADLLRRAGRTLISTVGGAAGPLYGTAFVRGAGALANGATASPAEAFVVALEAACGGIAGLGKATAGEKTMLDALLPAAAAARTALDAGGDSAAVTAAAASAASAGMEATIPMLATKGRASYLGERSIGHQDPGATSAALLLGVLADVARR
ncbi:MAG TPA: dihydroxyacetone kinase subunit DhaL [Candidatus Limnocylindrales bacterium]|jgi:dihydroxyacetone kinase-like protein|nr:dihydroxyacetone kinase subunit DhaL [Candidatus Limnocylindrales bacterium]